MLKLFTILFILSFNSFAEDVHPKPPEGWVEMHSIEPVILTWVKAIPEKGLEEVPSYMVQSFTRDEKFSKFLSSQKSDAKGCFEITTKEWKQTWCGRQKNVFVILGRGSDEDSAKAKEKLIKWALTHD